MFEALKAAVEERMRLARAAKNNTGRWSWGHGFGDMCNDATCPFGELLDEAEEDEDFAGTVLMQVHGYDIKEPWEGAAHIAANDPAFVIRACERDLKVLERHRRETFGDSDLPELLEVERDEPWCRVCRGSGWPCAEIRDLAEVYRINLGEVAQ